MPRWRAIGKKSCRKYQPWQHRGSTLSAHNSEPTRSTRAAIFTVGHSTRPISEFVDLLIAYGVERLVDIRTMPRSRHNPQFNADLLAEALDKASIQYVGLSSLGGLRHPRRDSPNEGLRNKSFRGYADYMQTDAFHGGLATLIEMSREKRVAIMCAEAVPWRCHRSLVADALTIRGIEVVDILSRQKHQLHKLSTLANVEGTTITYPPGQSSLI